MTNDLFKVVGFACHVLTPLMLNLIRVKEDKMSSLLRGAKYTEVLTSGVLE